MNNYIEYFTNYVYINYDMNNELISKKYYHSLRVAKIMQLLAKKLNVSDDDILLSFKLGLCHDLGRFHEVVRNGQFDNRIFDHGAYSNKILYNDNFINYMDIREHLLFRKAIYLHNKKDVSDDLTNRELLFANLLRDADKIDILGLRGAGNKLSFDSIPSEVVYNNYINSKSIDIHDIKSKSDTVLLYLGFFKCLVNNASFDMAVQGNYLKKVLDIIEVSEDLKELYQDIIDKIDEGRGKVYVR